MFQKTKTFIWFYLGAGIFFLTMFIIFKLLNITLLPPWFFYLFITFTFGYSLFLLFYIKNKQRKKLLEKKFQEYYEERRFKIKNWILLPIIIIVGIGYTITAYNNGIPLMRILLNVLVVSFAFTLLQNWKKLTKEMKLLVTLIRKRKKT